MLLDRIIDKLVQAPFPCNAGLDDILVLTRPVLFLNTYTSSLFFKGEKHGTKHLLFSRTCFKTYKKNYSSIQFSIFCVFKWHITSLFKISNSVLPHYIYFCILFKSDLDTLLESEHLRKWKWSLKTSMICFSSPLIRSPKSGSQLDRTLVESIWKNQYKNQP